MFTVFRYVASSVSQAFPSHKANNERWWGGGLGTWAPQMLTVQTISWPLSRVPALGAPGYSQYPGPGRQVRGLLLLLGHNNK